MNAKPATGQATPKPRTRNRDKTREALQYAILRVRNSGKRLLAGDNYLDRLTTTILAG